MKKIIFYSILFLTATIQNVSSQTTVLGKWKTIDDETGAPKSIVELYVQIPVILTTRFQFKVST